MEKYYITFRSVTYAQKGERLLKQKGILCYMQRTPRWMEEKGCGYAVEVRDPRQALEILRCGGAVWEKVYRLLKGQRPEAVEL